MNENCKAGTMAEGWVSVRVNELTRLRAIVARVEDVEGIDNILEQNVYRDTEEVAYILRNHLMGATT